LSIERQLTSLEAYNHTLKTLGKRQEEVLNCITNRQPITNLGLSNFLNKPINTITPRVKELRDKGLVVRAGKIITSTGRRAIQWQLAYLRELF